MEHRDKRRIKCRMNANLSYREITIPKCPIINANPEGALILTPEIELPEMVLVHMSLTRGQIRPPLNLRPLVVHSERGHAGLWFYNDQEIWRQIWRSLKNDEKFGRQNAQTRNYPLSLADVG